MFKIIPVEASKIKFDLYVRIKCMECPAYGKRYSCPPYTPLPLTSKRILENYKYCLIVLHKISLRDIYNRVWHLPKIQRIVLAHRIVNSLKRSINKKFELLASNFSGKVFHMTSPCHRCKKCNAPNLPCKYPTRRTHAPESFGIDVFGCLENINEEFEIVPRKYATAVGMIFTNKRVERKFVFEIPELKKEQIKFLEELSKERENFVKKFAIFDRVEDINFTGKGIFPENELKVFLKNRILLIFKLKKLNEKIVLYLKDFLFEKGLYDCVGILKNKKKFKNPRALCFTPKELGLEINIKDNEIGILTSKSNKFLNER